MKGVRDISPLHVGIPTGAPSGGIPPGPFTVSTENGTAVDRTGFDHADVLLDIGAIDPSNTGTVDVSLHHADDDGTGVASTFSLITSATIPQKTAEGKWWLAVNLRNAKKWIRAVAVFSCAACYANVRIQLRGQRSQMDGSPYDSTNGEMTTPDVEVL